MKSRTVVLPLAISLLGPFARCPEAFSASTDFKGAQWISAPSGSLALYADYLPVFKIGFDFSADSETLCHPGCIGSFIFGADDPRLMNPNLNIFGLENRPAESYIRMDIMCSGKATVPDSVAFYRKGYRPDDNPEYPLTVLRIGKLRPGTNTFQLAVNLGNTDVYINGKNYGHAGLNPIANGGDYLAFPVLGSIGVMMPGVGKASISSVSLRHYRQPSSVIWKHEGILAPGMLTKPPVRSMPEMRTTLTLDPTRQVAVATVNATAMGIYDLMVNGRRVHDDYFLPGSTQYNKTHLYHSFDITEHLHPGDNELRVQLGEGWWSGPSTYVGDNWNFFGDRQAFLGEIIIEYADGTAERIVTSPDNWDVSTDGPVVVGSFFQGEIYDARKAASDSRQWVKAEGVACDSITAPVAGGWGGSNLHASFGDRVLPVDTIAAVSFSEPRKGVYVYDMGQNMAGVPYIRFSGLKPGQEVMVRHGEVLYPDMPQYSQHAGMVMTENLRAAMCRDIYIADGADEEVFSPRHTLHGYRYLELTDLDSPLPLEAVKAVPVSSVHGFNAHFECSDTLVNRLWENIKWSTLSNFVSIPTDCPQRNERLGWMGDISVFSPTATKLCDIRPLLRQYLQSVRDCQDENGRFPDVAPTGFGFGGLLWGSAGIIVPWEYYCQSAHR